MSKLRGAAKSHEGWLNNLDMFILTDEICERGIYETAAFNHLERCHVQHR